MSNGWQRSQELPIEEESDRLAVGSVMRAI